ncbi:MAG: hypothetical protein HC803_10370, partial [Saprospiraceae bacterium]|nr:hypothetical protein [Saprospiraceae bacterium]
VVITGPTAPVPTVVSTDPTDCSLNDGTITVTVTPGTNASGANVATQYSIDGGTNWQASGNFTGLAPGTYNVFVRNVGPTCTVASIDNPIILNAQDAPSIINVSASNPTDCALTDGQIVVQATGGIAPLQYSIDGGSTWQASNTFTGLSAADNPIVVRVSNASGSCIATYPNITLVDKIAPVVSVTHTNVTNCGVTDGTITITASSGQGAVQYSINGGTTWAQSGAYTGLAAGTYQIRVRNIDGTCITTSPNVIITAPALPVITNIAPTNPTNCNVNDGQIVVTATGTSGTVEYSIDGGLTWQASNTFNSLPAGTYNVAIRYDNVTCFVLNPTATILTAPASPSITNVASTNPTNCGVTDGTITITATGGSGSYEYSIDGGTTWTNTTGIFTGLSAAGNPYQIRVRNAADNSCTVSAPNVTLINKVAPVIANVQGTNTSNCNVMMVQSPLQLLLLKVR